MNNKPCAIPTGKSRVLYNSKLVGFKKSILENNTKSEIPSSNATILKIRAINNSLIIKVIDIEFDLNIEFLSKNSSNVAHKLMMHLIFN